MALVDHLPVESATVSALRDQMTPEDYDQPSAGEGWGRWTREAELTALVAERLDWVIYTLIKTANPDAKPDKPKPIHRPGVFPERGPDMPSEAEIRYQHAITMASIAYSLEHDGAAPPPDWDPGLDRADFDD